MSVLNYHSVEGQLLGETGALGRRDYLVDGIGSVVATADQSATRSGFYPAASRSTVGERIVLVIRRGQVHSRFRATLLVWSHAVSSRDPFDYFGHLPGLRNLIVFGDSIEQSKYLISI